jgi:hypothetical protein
MTEPISAFSEYLRNIGADLDAGFLREAITMMAAMSMMA